MIDTFPDFTLVLDIIHVPEYGWHAANARWGETSPDRPPWVKQALTWLLTGQLDVLLHDWETPRPHWPASRQDVLAHVGADFRRNRPFMAYQRYLAPGWPIGTGVVDGACAHLVKARFEQSGRLWSFAGAQSRLDPPLCGRQGRLGMIFNAFVVARSIRSATPPPLPLSGLIWWHWRRRLNCDSK